MDFDNFFIFGIVIIIAYFIIRFFPKKKKVIEKETLDYDDIENNFFEEVKKGKSRYKLLEIYTSFDLMMIKSLFISESIPHYIEFGHLMKLYPFLHCQNYNNANMYILEEDYDDSINVIRNYIKNKNLSEYKLRSVGRNVFEYFIMAYVVPSPQNHLGIDVNSMNNSEHEQVVTSHNNW